ncbi:unnamed protein product [Oikopleura dioica]|uniref:Uncharacterized protein n=1 Tax=Oikopleura dioica TaxID=34765 RepID=E4Y5M9_OIKDI|nr:unnamed protein product [Oikopleura dioica]
MVHWIRLGKSVFSNNGSAIYSICLFCDRLDKFRPVRRARRRLHGC